jgi:hypothetical protein
MQWHQDSIHATPLHFPCDHFGRPHLLDRVPDNAKQARFAVQKINLIHAWL